MKLLVLDSEKKTVTEMEVIGFYTRRGYNEASIENWLVIVKRAPKAKK